MRVAAHVFQRHTTPAAAHGFQRSNESAAQLALAVRQPPPCLVRRCQAIRRSDFRLTVATPRFRVEVQRNRTEPRTTRRRRRRPDQKKRLHACAVTDTPEPSLSSLPFRPRGMACLVCCFAQLPFCSNGENIAGIYLRRNPRVLGENDGQGILCAQNCCLRTTVDRKKRCRPSGYHIHQIHFYELADFAASLYWAVFYAGLHRNRQRGPRDTADQEALAIILGPSHPAESNGFKNTRAP